MRARSLFLILTLLATIPTLAQTADPLKGEVVGLKGKLVTLRHFYADNSLHYNEDGELVGKSESGPWTIDGRLEIENVSVKDDRINMDCKRAWVRFANPGGDQVNAVTPIFVTIRIDLAQGAERVARWRKALPKIFFTKATPISDDAPDYWQTYLGGTKVAAAPSVPDSASAGKPLEKPLRVRVNQGVTEGMILHKEQPQYPPEARAAHHQGTVVLQALIGKDGHLRDLQITHPVGMGLDDAAAVAVQKWLYRPYLLKGEPVEVDTQITVNFILSR